MHFPVLLLLVGCLAGGQLQVNEDDDPNAAKEAGRQERAAATLEADDAAAEGAEEVKGRARDFDPVYGRPKPWCKGGSCRGKGSGSRDDQSDPFSEREMRKFLKRLMAAARHFNDQEIGADDEKSGAGLPGLPSTWTGPIPPGVEVIRPGMQTHCKMVKGKKNCVSLDPGEVIRINHTVFDASKGNRAIGSRGPGNDVGNFGSNLDKAGSGMNDVENGLQGAGNEMAGAGSGMGINGVSGAGNEGIGMGMGNAAGNAGNDAGNGVNAAGNGLKAAGNGAGTAVNEAGNGAGTAVNEAGTAVNEAGNGMNGGGNAGNGANLAGNGLTGPGNGINKDENGEDGGRGSGAMNERKIDDAVGSREKAKGIGQNQAVNGKNTGNGKKRTGNKNQNRAVNKGAGNGNKNAGGNGRKTRNGGSDLTGSSNDENAAGNENRDAGGGSGAIESRSGAGSITKRSSEKCNVKY